MRIKDRFVSVLAFTSVFFAISFFVYAVPFTPGEGGSIPAFEPLQPVAGRIGGLYVDRTHRRNALIGGGTRAVVDLRFYHPSEFEADSYTLQYSGDGTTWQNYQSGGEDLTTTGDNFSLSSPGGSYYYRLLVNEGPQAGDTSNIVYAPLSSVNTRFSGWSLDWSMYISGVMWPFVGYGLEATFSVAEVGDSFDPVEGHVDYKWYRVHPLTYEMTPIPGATGQTYITTEDDVGGYLLIVRGTGDGVNVGGFAQILAGGHTVIPNHAYATNVTADGFILNLFKKLPGGLAPEDLNIGYWDEELAEWVEPVITSITELSDNAVFQVEVNIPFRAELWVNNVSQVWTIASEGFHGHHLMEGMQVSRELLSNPDFWQGWDDPGEGWEVADGVDRGEVFADWGQANLHIPGFTGTLLWQPLDIPDVANGVFQARMHIASDSYPPGSSIAVYLDYMDNLDAPQRAIIFNPANDEIGQMPNGTVFNESIVLPASARCVTGFSLDRDGPGEFIAFEFSLIADGKDLSALPGDINGDGAVNISDVILCLRIAVNLPVVIDGEEYTAPYPEWLIERADMNGDGVVNISDVILILRKSVGLD